MIGYHFVGDLLRDGRPVPADGEWLVHDGPILPCKRGLHASEHPFDALRYARGATLCLVELDGDIVPHGDPVDKHVGRRRRIIKRIDATYLLRRFAADQALSVKHLWDMPAIVEEYLTTLDETKRDAAWDAACRSPWDTSWDSHSSMAQEKACEAAREAEWHAAAWHAAMAAAWDSEWDAVWEDFKRRVDAAFNTEVP